MQDWSAPLKNPFLVSDEEQQQQEAVKMHEGDDQAGESAGSEALAAAGTFEYALAALKAAKATVLGACDADCLDLDAVAAATAAAGSANASAEDSSPQAEQRRRVATLALLELQTRLVTALLHASRTDLDAAEIESLRMLAEARKLVPATADAGAASTNAQSLAKRAKITPLPAASRSLLPPPAAFVSQVVLLLLEAHWVQSQTKSRLTTHIARIEAACALLVPKTGAGAGAGAGDGSASAPPGFIDAVDRIVVVLKALAKSSSGKKKG